MASLSFETAPVGRSDGGRPSTRASPRRPRRGRRSAPLPAGAAERRARRFGLGARALGSARSSRSC